VQSNDIIDVLENQEAVRFMKKHVMSDLVSLSLQFSGKVTFNLAVCLQLMDVYKRARVKLPTLAGSMIAIDKRSYEQCTSEAIAKFKQEFIKGNSLLDITGGIGVDALYLAKNFNRIVVVERNERLHELAQYNNHKLGIENIERNCEDGENFISEKYDWIYIDPDRRKEEIRSVALENLEPNILELIPKLNKFSSYCYIKLSPLYDIAEVWRKFENASDVYILSEKGEIKEVGVVLNFEEQFEKKIHLVEVTNNFRQTIGQPVNNLTRFYSSEKFENVLLPNSLLLKSRITQFFLDKIKTNKHPLYEVYYANEPETEGFRTLRILGVTSMATRSIKKLLKANDVNQINILLKGLRDNPINWHKKLNTRDGGEFYLLLLKSEKSEALLCKLIS